MPVTTFRSRGAVAVLGFALAVTACGSGSTKAQNGTDKSTGGNTADVVAARALIAPLQGKPSAFPIDTPLARGAAGKRIAYLDCGSPICGLFFTLGQPAAQALGMKMTRVKAGLNADSVAAAFDTVVQDKYDGVFVPAIQPSLWQKGLDQLVAAKIPVVTAGITGADASKIEVRQVADGTIDRAGKLLAAWVIADTGAKTNVVFYDTPETAFNPVLEGIFLKEVKRLCGSCTARAVKVPASTLGTTAPSLITNDLQAHPKTTTAVFAQAAQTQGLPSALKTASVHIHTLATFPDPGQLALIKSGDLTAGLALDVPVVTWTVMDSLARLTTAQPAAPGAKADIPPLQLLTAADLPGDVSHGWTGYPDFAKRFLALWKQA